MSDSTNTRQATCAERIGAHLESRASQFGALTDLAGAYDYSRLLEVLEDSDTRELLAELQPGDVSAELLELLTMDPESVPDDVDLEDRLIDESVSVDEIAEAARTRIYELPLSVERNVVFRVDLSTGGPADWLEVRCSGEEDAYEIDGITYVFQDWFDGARQEMTGAELEAATEFARALIPELQ